MTVGSILGNALSALYVNQEALKITSDNIANVNTPGYTRKVADLSPQVLAGQTVGVELSQVRRVVDQFFITESLKAASDFAQYDVQSRYYDQLQSIFGSPDQQLSLSARLNKALTSLADLSLDVTSSVRRDDALNDLQSLADTFNFLSSQIQNLRSDIDRRIGQNTTSLNNLFEQAHSLNAQIEHTLATGGDATGLQDERDRVFQQISEFMDVRTIDTSGGAVHLATQDGFVLVGHMYAELTYQPQNSFTVSTLPTGISAMMVNPLSGERVPPATAIDSRINSGEMHGLLEMRDGILPTLQMEIGNLAGAIVDEMNAIHNDNVAFPAPNALTGRNTGLLSTDSLGFTGQTTLAITAADGSLVSRIDIDFDAGTLSVDGGGIVALGGTIGSMITAIDTALGANGSASFVNGVLSVQAANSTNGIAFAQDAADPSDRGGRGFSHFFGLNDIMTATSPSHFDTGLTGTDAHGFTPGETITFQMRNADGSVTPPFTYTVAGATLNDILTDLNDPVTGYGSYMSFALDANGAITATPNASYGDYAVFVTDDTTSRGATAMTMSGLFGWGDSAVMDRANNVGLTPRIASNNNEFALAKLDLQGAVTGDIVVSASDNRGALDLQSLATKTLQVDAVGTLGSASVTLSEYSALVLSNASSEAARLDALKADTLTLKDEIEGRRDSVQGVNMDEELANMMVYQQSYNAAARLITTARELFDALLDTV